jgi:hypothetical protein
VRRLCLCAATAVHACIHMSYVLALPSRSARDDDLLAADRLRVSYLPSEHIAQAPDEPLFEQLAMRDSTNALRGHHRSGGGDSGGGGRRPPMMTKHKQPQRKQRKQPPPPQRVRARAHTASPRRCARVCSPPARLSIIGVQAKSARQQRTAGSAGAAAARPATATAAVGRRRGGAAASGKPPRPAGGTGMWRAGGRSLSPDLIGGHRIEDDREALLGELAQLGVTLDPAH